MKIKPLFFYLAAVFTANSFSDTYIFDRFFGGITVSRIVPSGKLKGLVSPAMNYGIKLKSPYYKYLNSHVILNYSQLSSGKKSLYTRKIHYLQGGIGLGFKPGNHFLPETGIGLDLSLIRSANPEPSPSLLMDDNESEFGMYPFVSWNIPFTKKWYANIDALWSIVFSQPFYGHLPRVGIGIGKILW